MGPPGFCFNKSQLIVITLFKKLLPIFHLLTIPSQSLVY